MKQKLMLGFVVLGLMMPQVYGAAKIDQDRVNENKNRCESVQHKRNLMKWGLRSATALATVGGAAWYYNLPAPVVPQWPIPEGSSLLEVIKTLNAEHVKATPSRLKTVASWLVIPALSFLSPAISFLASDSGTVAGYVHTQTNLIAGSHPDFMHLVVNATSFDLLLQNEMNAQEISVYENNIEEVVGRIVSDLERVLGFMLYKVSQVSDETLERSLRAKTESLIQFANDKLEQMNGLICAKQLGATVIAKALASEVARRINEFDRLEQCGV